MPVVHLAPFDPINDLPMVASWLRCAHVAPWWGDPEQALAAVREHPTSTEALIKVDARPVGLLCWQTLSPEELAAADLGDLPSDLVDVDILIGEAEALGQGVGPAALRQLLATLRASGVRIVGLAAAVANARALRAYEKAGCRPFRDFREGGQDVRYLVQTLHAAV